MINRRFQAVMLTNGLYVSDWQYSQGNLDLKTTMNPWEAIPVDQNEYEVFFKNYFLVEIGMVINTVIVTGPVETAVKNS